MRGSACATLAGLAGVLTLLYGAPNGTLALRQTAGAVPVTYEGFYNVRTNGDDTTYGQGLTHRYVDGELRLLTIAHPTTLHEFRISGAAFGSTITQTTNRWNLASTGGLNNFNAIWYEQAKNRLWITSAEDYTDTNHPARVTLVGLGTGGSVTVIKRFFLNVPAKRVYGGCDAVPAPLVAQFGGPYVCGWGGYTSLVNSGGGASIGPTMYAIPDPDTIANGATVQVRAILDAAPSNQHRGVRRTIPLNYFDGGDPRPNPPTRPTVPPVASGAWLSPNSDGLGWMVWGDSYYNTGVWIGTTYAAVASLCQGACWYQSGTLAFDGRQFELHQWNGAALGGNLIARPTSMVELNLPRGNTTVWSGNVTAGNIAGATYDAVSGRLYMIGFPLGPDVFTGRLYSFLAGSGGPAPPPAPGAPVDAIVSDWSAWAPVGDWTACSGGIQLRTEERTRSVIVPAANGGLTPPLLERRTASQSCGGSTARLQAHLVASGLDRPIGVVQHPTDARVQLILEQGGRVRVLSDDALLASDFIDLSSQTAAGGEQGLLGLAFAPDFATSGRAYVSFTDRAGHSVVARYVRLASDPLRLDPSSRFDLRWPTGQRVIEQPFSNHNGGHLAFGPDGYLYIGLGDGGSSDDPLRHAQNPLSLLGKMLRIDVAVDDADERGYRVPASNPFVGSPGVLPEIWAFGLRNPWRWSFDLPAAGGTGALVIADAGEAGWEEVNVEPAGGGGRNYGWPVREGGHDRATTSALFPAPLADPVWEYGRDVGRAIIGGYVYRGSALGSAYVGRYFFADYPANRIWSMAIGLDPPTGRAVAGALIEHSAELAAAAASPVSFGVDAAGELLIVSYGGSIHRIGRIDGGGRSRTGPTVGTARPR